MANVTFIDNSIEVKAALNETTIAWLNDWAPTIASHAKEHTQLDGEAGDELRKSYSFSVNETTGEALVGSAMEAAFWEEFGTGSYAVHGDGRPGWWIYIEGQESMGGGRTYSTKEEAQQMAAYIRAKYGKPAVVTNGRKPSKTLETAFTENKPKAIADMERRMKGRMG